MKTITARSYVEQRDKLISDIVNLSHLAYPDDRKIKSNVIELTTILMIADNDQKFIDGMRGFMVWASMANKTPYSVLATLIHDLVEFSRNRYEPWFSPRTSRYEKYLTGASGELK